MVDRYAASGSCGAAPHPPPHTPCVQSGSILLSHLLVKGKSLELKSQQKVSASSQARTLHVADVSRTHLKDAGDRLKIYILRRFSY